MRQATQTAVEIMQNARALAMKKTTAADFDDITANECPQACVAERCVISGKPYCAHPFKGGPLGVDISDHAVIARIAAVKKIIKRNEATQNAEQESAQ